MELVTTPAATMVPRPRGKVRWLICLLIFAGVVLSYVDRLVLPVLKPTLQRDYGWSEEGYGYLNVSFQAAYGIGFLFFGRLIDRVGAKTGYLLAMGLWTAAHMLQAAFTSTFAFAIARIPLALGESGTYPAALAAASDWFPRRERALAIGIFNAGANVGAIVTPLLVPIVALAMGWQAAFIVTGLINVVWLAAWLIFYRKPKDHPTVTAEEVAYISADPVDHDQVRVPFRQILGTRQAWAYMAGRFLIDPVWWTFLFWLPDFFHARFGVSLKDFGPPLVAVYVLADVGSIAGGWYSSHLLGRGVETGRARRRAMLACAIIVVPVMASVAAPNLWVAVVLLGLACAGHQGFSSNLFAMPADLFPRWALGSVVGLGGFAGALGGMLMSAFAGRVLQTVGSYTPIFVVSGCAYLLAFVVVRAINPSYAKVTKFARPPGLDAAA